MVILDEVNDLDYCINMIDEVVRTTKLPEEKEMQDKMKELQHEIELLRKDNERLKEMNIQLKENIKDLRNNKIKKSKKIKS